MKNFSGTFVFAAIVVALGGFAYWDYQNSLEDEAEEAKSELVIPDWNESMINELKVSMNSELLHVKKENGKWQIIEPIKDEAETSAVKNYISSILTNKVTTVPVEGSINWANYGLEAAKGFIELVAADTKTKRVNISSKKTFDGQVYLRVSESEKLLLASSTWDSWLNKNANDIRNKKILPEGTIINSFKSKKLKLVREDGVWELEGDKKFKVDSNKLNNVLNGIKSFKANDVVAEEVNPKTKAEYGFRRPRGSLELKLEGRKEPIRIYIGREDGEKNRSYVYTSEKPFIYEGNSSIINNWLVTRDTVKEVHTEKKEEPKDNAQDPHRGHDHGSLDTKGVVGES